MAEGDGEVAEVVVLAKPDRVFHYTIPRALREAVVPGARVQVSFGRRVLDGFVVGTVDRSEIPDLKPIAGVLDADPVFPPSLLALTRWIADYYLAPLGGVLATAAPAGRKIAAGKRVGPAPGPRTQTYVELVTAGPVVAARAPRQSAVLTALAARGGGALLAELGPGAAAACRALAGRGVVSVSARAVPRDPYAGTRPSSPPAALTSPQRRALDAITPALERRRFAPFLLWGVTGSGKTEVYLQAMAAALALGRGCLLLVPEIALTGQVVERVRGRFGDRTAVLHSGLSGGERFEAWNRLRRGEALIALGTRSALFAPVRDLGLIVVDEEQDASYKQEDGVRYHARDSAMVLAREVGAVMIAGSATPSLESYANAVDDRYRLLTLPERVHSRPLPAVRLVDLRGERDPGTVLSSDLRDAVGDRLSRKEQVLLLLNRRGYAPVILCRDCGVTARCPQCCVGLTFHRARGRLCCHYCGLTAPPSERCDACGGHRVTWHGVGTEQVEERLREAWPHARIARMDRDTTRTRFAHDAVLNRMRAEQIDILVGTQMIAKGHDLPNVTLVGIINADVGLSLPDFRAAERVFQLLAQAAGRAGRGARPGEVIIQTRRPSHDALRFAQRHDVAGFYARELDARRALGYPPFGRLVILLVSGLEESRVIRAAQIVAEAARTSLSPEVALLGPAPAPFWRLKGRHRWQLLLKGPRRGDIVRHTTRDLLARVAASRTLGPGVTLSVDVDPHQVV